MIMFTLALFGAAFILFCLYSAIVSWLEDRAEKRAIKKHREAAQIISGQINDAQFWLTGDNRRPYRDVLISIVEQLACGNYIKGQWLRETVDEIINMQKPKR